MRIALIIPSFFPATVYGGSIFASYNLTKEAVREGADVWVSTTNANGLNRIKTTVNEFQNLDGFKVKYYHEEWIKFFSFRLILNIWKDIKCADIVHVQGVFSYPIPFALIYAYLFRKKIFFSPRGSFSSYSFRNRPFLKYFWIKFFISPFIKKIYWHATSKKEKREIISVFKNARVEILSDGAYVSEKNLSLKDNYLAAMGRIHPVKGYDLLIEAFPKVISFFPNIKLKIAGLDDGDKNRLENLIIKHEIQSHVKFVGELKDDLKASFLQKAKCLLMPSYTESFGIVAIEAMAEGTPVIASKNTPWQILEEVSAGFWIDNDPVVIANTIIMFLKGEQEKYQKNAQLLAKKYDWKHIAKEYKKILEKIYND